MKLEEKILLFNIARGKIYFEGRVKSLLTSEVFTRKCHISDAGEVLDGCGNVLMDSDDFAETEKTGIGSLAFDEVADIWYTTSADNLSSEEVAAILEAL